MRFLLSGYYGFGNIGDEALLRVIVRELQRRHPGSTVDVLSATPEETSTQLGVIATPRAQLSAVRESISAADVVLSGGGGLLQNATSLRSLLYYAGVIRSAAKAQRKTMIFAQSIGPLDFWGKMVVKQWCKGITSATVRDARSEQLLRSLLPDTSCERTADPVFLYDEADEDYDFGVAPVIVVSVRKCAGLNEGATIIARAVDRLSDEYGVHVAFVPLGGQEDAEAATVVIRKCKSSPVLLPVDDLPRISGMIKRAHAVIGMRLHSLIFAIRYGVPFLSIPYDPKVAGLCEDIAYPLAPLWTPGEKTRPLPAQTDRLVDRLMSDREKLSAYLLGQSGRLRALAERNFEVLDEVVREQPPSTP